MSKFGLTYKELNDVINSMSEEQQNQDVTICFDGEFYGEVIVNRTEEDDILDKDHCYLIRRYDNAM